MEAKPAKVLLVDDDRDLVMVCKLVLESRGYIVDTAFTGREALERIDDLAPDLLVLDVMMEDVASGFEVLHAVRAKPEFAGLPVLMISSVQQRMNMRVADKAGGPDGPASEFLEKPVEPTVLLDKVARLLGR